MCMDLEALFDVKQTQSVFCAATIDVNSSTCALSLCTRLYKSGEFAMLEGEALRPLIDLCGLVGPERLGAEAVLSPP